MTDTPLPRSPGQPAWSAVLAMALAAFALVASEFMPVSLLTPIAADLHVSEGQAGQGIAVSGAFALTRYGTLEPNAAAAMYSG